MDYLTNYYKNLCEQLEQKIVHLESHLNESRKVKDVKTGREVPVRKVDVQDFEWTGEDVPLVTGQYADGKGKGAQKTREVQFYPGYAVPQLSGTAETMYAQELGSNSPYSPEKDNVFSNAMRRGGSPIDVVASEVSEVRGKKAGSAARGRGKKAMKKKMAQIRAKYRGKSVNEDLLNEIEQILNESED